MSAPEQNWEDQLGTIFRVGTPHSPLGGPKGPPSGDALRIDSSPRTATNGETRAAKP
jgi:hypothetical protein